MKLVKKSLMAFILMGSPISIQHNENQRWINNIDELEEIRADLLVPLLEPEPIDIEDNRNPNQQPINLPLRQQQQNNLRQNEEILRNDETDSLGYIICFGFAVLIWIIYRITSIVVSFKKSIVYCCVFFAVIFGLLF